MTDRLKMAENSKRALVTGASSGIGQAYAQLLAQRGHHLVLVARRGERLKQLADRLNTDFGADVQTIIADLVDPSDLKKVEDRLEHGDIDLLVNNAGIGDIALFAEQSRDVHSRMIALNVTAVTRLAHAAVQGMLPRGQGTIINIGSGFAFDYREGASVYAATKSFVVQFTKVLHEELAQKGLRFQVVIPGLTRTELGGGGSTDFFDQFPPEMVMSPETLVETSLASLELGELVCLPRTEDYGQYERMHEAVRAVGRTPPHNVIASRYTALMQKQGA